MTQKTSYCTCYSHLKVPKKPDAKEMKTGVASLATLLPLCISYSLASIQGHVG